MMLLGFRFPLKNQELLKKWIVALRRDGWQPGPSDTLCSEHFDSTCFRHYSLQVRLKEDAVPSLFHFPPHLCEPATVPRRAIHDVYAGDSRVTNMSESDYLPSGRRKIRCCLKCRSIDSVHVFRFPKDYRRQLWCDYCERYKPGFTLKEYHRLCSVSIMLCVVLATIPKAELGLGIGLGLGLGLTAPYDPGRTSYA